ncbi:ATP-binding cassette domain-containing protein [Streptomyces sp. SudanB182_2057]|uniref:ABC transporter ATP-binding protein n=1 Tax=Streptomyces sp. SudanB182_2057 TaxID=3035281 RepID=UPI003F564494
MINTRGLTRSFRAEGETVEAVRDLDLDGETGSVVAFLGPNGAGKTTSLRMLTTLLPPTSGTAVVAGHDILTDPSGVRHRIGCLGQGNSAGSNYRVSDKMIAQGRAYGLSRAESRTRAERLLTALELEGLAKRTVGTLSGGRRRRLDIAMALVHQPELLFLDEPTTGLGPHSRANVWEHVLRLHKELGTTIVFTTHYLEEVDLWARRVMVVDHGRVIADDFPEMLKADLAGDRITLGTVDRADAERAVELARALPTVQEVTADGTEVRVRPHTATTPRSLRSPGAAPAASSGSTSINSGAVTPVVPQDGQPAPVFVLVDLATGEPFGEELVGGGTRRSGTDAAAVPSQPRHGTVQKDTEGDEQRPEDDHAHGHGQQAPATGTAAVPEHNGGSPPGRHREPQARYQCSKFCPSPLPHDYPQVMSRSGQPQGPFGLRPGHTCYGSPQAPCMVGRGRNGRRPVGDLRRALARTAHQALLRPGRKGSVPRRYGILPGSPMEAPLPRGRSASSVPRSAPAPPGPVAGHWRRTSRTESS